MENLKTANGLYKQGRYKEALEVYKQIVQEKPVLERTLAINIKMCLAKLESDSSATLAHVSNEETSSGQSKFSPQFFSEVDMHGTEINLYPKPCYESRGYSLDVNVEQPVQILDYENSAFIPNQKFNVGIHLHLFYIDLLEDFINFLKNISLKFSLYVSLVDEASKFEVEKKLKSHFPSHHVLVKVFDNRGRDISHFVVGFAKELQNHEIIGHFHSKRSPHNFAKADWRRQLVSSLMGSESIFNRIMTIFDESKNIGMVFPSYHHSLKGQISWGTNYDISLQTARKLNIDIDKEHLALFPAGSMFWSRTTALEPLFKAGLSYDDFPEEDSQVDGTLAHAVERLFGHIVNSQGFDLIQVKPSKQYNLVKYFPKKYPYRETNKTVEAISRYKKEKGKNNKIAVFTALSGGYEELPRHKHLDLDIDYIAFCDQPIDTQGFWEIRPMDFWHPEKVRMARRIKTNPHIYLKGYDIAIWIDANVVIESTLAHYIEKFRSSDFAVGSIHHPVRNCVYHEAKALVEAKKDVSGRVEKQMKSYRERGYPEYHGLTETNLMMSKLYSPQTDLIMNRWWSEIVKFSHRDQLSFNYSLWTEGLEWQRLMDDNLSLRDSADFAYLGHGRNSGYIKLQNNTVAEVSPESWEEKTVKKNTNVRIDIIICVHNALEEVKACLKSVLKSRVRGDRILIVDDASDEETALFLSAFAKKNKDVILERNNKDATGYCKSANRGMALVQSEVFLLLNSDTVLTRDALMNMKNTMLSDENIGLVGPMSNAASSQSIPDISNTDKQTAVNNLPAGVSIDEMNRLCCEWANPFLMPSVPLVHGFCQLIRKKVYEEIGGFDEESFPNGYGEENDFCLRAADAGFDLKICTKAFVFHEKSASYKDDDKRIKLMQLGSAKLKSKHSEDRLVQAIKTMEGHHLLVEMRKKANAFINERLV